MRHETDNAASEEFEADMTRNTSNDTISGAAEDMIREESEEDLTTGVPARGGGSREETAEAADAADAADVHTVPDEARDDVAERPGHTQADHDHADELADEWGDESFPASDPPAHH